MLGVSHIMVSRAYEEGVLRKPRRWFFFSSVTGTHEVVVRCENTRVVFSPSGASEVALP